MMDTEFRLQAIAQERQAELRHMTLAKQAREARKAAREVGPRAITSVVDSGHSRVGDREPSARPAQAG